MGGADVGNADVLNESDHRVSGTVQYNKPRVVGDFPIGKKIQVVPFRVLYYTPRFMGMSSVGSGEDVMLLD